MFISYAVKMKCLAYHKWLQTWQCFNSGLPRKGRGGRP
uniref:Uncharacterized protein n=1 Tax=Anguilla anguilla TaxID=7936 RepID=A0A0E9QK59_ANGAN